MLNSNAFAAVVDRKSLVAALDVLGKVVEKRGSIPVLSTVRLRTLAGALMISATDLDLEATARLVAECQPGGDVLLDLSGFAQAVKKGKAESVRLVDVGGAVAVECGATIRLPAPMSPSDFPAMVRRDVAAAFALPAFQLRHDLARVSTAISTEETRYYLNGVFVHLALAGAPAERTPEHEAATVELAALRDAQYKHERASAEGGDGQDDPATVEARTIRMQALRDFCEEAEAVRCAPDCMRFATTDGHRLVRVTRPLPGGSGTLPDSIIPRKVIGVLGKVLGKLKADAPVDFAFAKSAVAIDVEAGAVRWSFYSKLIDGTFPDYSRVIPSHGNGAHRVTVPAVATAELVGATTAHCSGRIRGVTLSWRSGADWLVASASDPDAGRAMNVGAARAEHDGERGEDGVVGMNSAYLCQALGTFGDADVVLSCEDPAAPVRLDSPDVPELVLVVMPMRVGESFATPDDVRRLNQSPVDVLRADLALTQGAKPRARLIRAAIDHVQGTGPRRPARLAVLALVAEMEGDIGRAAQLKAIAEHVPTSSFRAWSESVDAGLASRVQDPEPVGSAPVEPVAEPEDRVCASAAMFPGYLWSEALADAAAIETVAFDNVDGVISIINIGTGRNFGNGKLHRVAIPARHQTRAAELWAEQVDRVCAERTARLDPEPVAAAPEPETAEAVPMFRTLQDFKAAAGVGTRWRKSIWRDGAWVHGETEMLRTVARVQARDIGFAFGIHSAERAAELGQNKGNLGWLGFPKAGCWRSDANGLIVTYPDGTPNIRFDPVPAEPETVATADIEPAPEAEPAPASDPSGEIAALREMVAVLTARLDRLETGQEGAPTEKAVRHVEEPESSPAGYSVGETVDSTASRKSPAHVRLVRAAWRERTRRKSIDQARVNLAESIAVANAENLRERQRAEAAEGMVAKLKRRVVRMAALADGRAAQLKRALDDLGFARATAARLQRDVDAAQAAPVLRTVRHVEPTVHYNLTALSERAAG